MMNIAIFTTQADAQAKLDLYNTWANVPSGCTLTFIYQHTMLPVWWFFFDDCVSNGGLGASKIQDNMINITTSLFADRQELISSGYLPPDVND